MFPSKSRDARAANGASGDPAHPAEDSSSIADERLSHLKPTYQGHEAAARSSERRAATTSEDAGALLIGGGVELKGRIGSCDSLVVEGTVESTIECRSIEIRQSGIVAGEARVESAIIEGRFDGDLIVTGCLTVHASGRISGSVRYGEIEVERGGEIAGDVATFAAEPAAAAAREADYPSSPHDPEAEELAARIEAL